MDFSCSIQVVIGNGNALQSGKYWGEWLAWALANDLCMSSRDLNPQHGQRLSSTMVRTSQHAPNATVASNLLSDEQYQPEPVIPQVNPPSGSTETCAHTENHINESHEDRQDQNVFVETQLHSMLVSELKAVAKARGLKGYSKLTKKSLVDMLSEPQ